MVFDNRFLKIYLRIGFDETSVIIKKNFYGII